jgi:hypothetical protein
VLQFKAFYLQIHRTREILLAGGATEGWWQKLVRSGKNDFADVEHILLDPTHLEIARGLDSYEQTIKDVERSLLKIIEFVRKPILLVSTFNTDYNGNPVPQRTVLEKAMNQVARDVRCAFFDPTQTVLRAGITNAILDLGHYKPDFEKEIADQMLKVIEKSLLECK